MRSAAAKKPIQRPENTSKNESDRSQKKTKERALVCVWSENQRPEESDTKGNGTGENCPDEYVAYESRILIIGETGTVGRQVASQLASTGVKARALVRQPDAARLPAEIEVVRGDLTFPEALDRSLNGVDTVFLVWTAPPVGVTPALERIASHADRIVFLSAPFKTPHPLFQQPNPSRALAEQIERLIESSRTSVDVSSARNVCGKRPTLVGTTDPRWRRRALAVPRSSYGAS